MSDFECLPIGTAARLKELEADVQHLQSALNDCLDSTIERLKQDLDRLSRGTWSIEIARQSKIASELRAEVERLRKALEYVVRQNEHDMILTGEECRAARSTLKDGQR